MRCRIAYAGLVGSALTLAFSEPGCALRVGAGAPSSSGNPPADAGADVQAATKIAGDGGFSCAPDGNEQKLPFGTGTDAFAWAWDTDHYVVVYVDPTQGNGGDIYVATLAADGSMRTAPVAVDVTPGASDLPSLVKTSQGYVVVWEEGTAGQSIYVHALGSDGSSPVGSGVSIGTTQVSDARPVISTAPGGETAVVWKDEFNGIPGVDFALLNPDPSSFAVTGPQRIPANDQASWPWVAGDDQVIGMLWSDLSSNDDAATPAYEIEFSPVDARSLSAPSISDLPADGPFNQQLGRMVRTSFGFIAAWEDEESDGGENQIQMAFLDSGGSVQKNGLVEQPHTGDANWPNIAWTGSYAGIVYYQWRTGLPQVYMTFFDSMGSRAAPTDMQISDGTKGGARFPDVVWTGTEFGVMYIDTRDGQPELWMHRVQCTG